jgi:hypothetical protein
LTTQRETRFWTLHFQSQRPSIRALSVPYRKVSQNVAKNLQTSTFFPRYLEKCMLKWYAKSRASNKITALFYKREVSKVDLNLQKSEAYKTVTWKIGGPCSQCSHGWFIYRKLFFLIKTSRCPTVPSAVIMSQCVTSISFLS